MPPAFARLELEDHLAFIGAPGQPRLEGAACAVADEFVQHIGFALLQQLVHLLGLHGLLQDDLAAFEVAARRGLRLGGHGFFAHIAFAKGFDGRAALGARPQVGLGRQVHDLARLLGAGVVAKVKLQFELAAGFVFDQGELGHERPAGLAAKTLQRADAALAQKGFGLVHGKGAPARVFGEGKAAAFAAPIRAGAGVAAVVFFDHAAAIGAGRVQRGVVAGHGVAVVFLGFFDDALGHGGDLAHEGLARKLAFFHLRQLVFPVAGQLGPAEFFHLQAAQQGHELKGLGRGHQLAPFAQHVLLANQPFDDGRARGRRAQAFFLHGLAQLVVVDPLARAFHGAQQRGFAVARGGAGLQVLRLYVLVAHHLAGLDGHQRFATFALFLVHLGIGLFAVNGQPAGLDQHLAVALEVVALALV